MLPCRRELGPRKHERQYEHIKENEQERGRSTGAAKRIAAATVNKTRSERDEGGKGALARALCYAEFRKSLGSFKK